MADRVAQWGDVAVLSDDEVGGGQPPPPQRDGAAQRPSPASSRVPDPHKLRSFFTRVTVSLCQCSRRKTGGLRESCFSQFVTDVDNLVRLRLDLDKLDKQDMDDKAWSGFKSNEKSRSRLLMQE